MRILLLGYGKMGKAIEQEAPSLGHTVVAKVDTAEERDNIADEVVKQVDVAIDFTEPEAAIGNIFFCLKRQIPLVVGTTGWYSRFQEVREEVQSRQGALFTATNFSLGVQAFFRIARQLTRQMESLGLQAYLPTIQEIHHLEKKDAPSGTAITLAENVIRQSMHLKSWALDSSDNQNKPYDAHVLAIQALREPNVPGTHVLSFGSDIDTIALSHTAHNRRGFALGALAAASFLIGKKGMYGMDDLLGEE